MGQEGEPGLASCRVSPARKQQQQHRRHLVRAVAHLGLAPPSTSFQLHRAKLCLTQAPPGTETGSWACAGLRSRLGASTSGPRGSQQGGGGRSPEGDNHSHFPAAQTLTASENPLGSQPSSGRPPRCLPLPSQPLVATGLGWPLPSPSLPSAWPDPPSDTQEEASARGGQVPQPPNGSCRT